MKKKIEVLKTQKIEIPNLYIIAQIQLIYMKLLSSCETSDFFAGELCISSDRDLL